MVEATAGNTGLGLALVARAKGYRVVLVVPDKMSTEKVLHLKALGAEVHITRSDVGKGHPDYYQDCAARARRATIPGAFFADQFNNPANPLAHETSTGPEIWAQTRPRRRRDRRRRRLGRHDHRADALLPRACSPSSSSCSPIRSARSSPSTRAAARIGEAGSWAVEGIGEDFIPSIADLSGVRDAYSIADEESFAHRARAAARAKASSAARRPARCSPRRCATAASRHAPKRVVSFVCDTGTRYLSKVYNDQWMIDQGLLARATLRRPARPDRAPRRGRRRRQRRRPTTRC